MAVPVVVSTSRVQPASTTTVTVPLPTGWADGDMMLAVISTASSSQTVTTPAGWTYVTNQTRDGFGTSNVYFFYRILTSSESAPSFTVSASSANHLGEGFLIRGQDNATPIPQFAGATVGNFTTGITMPTVTTTDNNCLLFFYETKYAGNTTADHTWTNATEVTDFGWANQKVSSATSSQVTAGTTPSNISVTSGGSSSSTALAAVTLAIREAQFATKTDGDTATGSDAAAARAFTPAVDAGAGTDNATQKVSGAVDSGVGTDTATARAFGPAADTAAGTDNAAARVFVPAADSGAATDDALATNTPQSGDIAAGTESSTLKSAGSDTSTGTDAATLKATVVQNDSGAGSENVTIRVRPTTESGAGTDNAIIRHKPNDSGAGTDNASVRGYRPSPDTATGTDTTSRVIIFASDSAVGTDAAFKSISGELQASRLVVVQPESRVHTIDFESRLTIFDREVRLVIVGEEL